MPDNSSLKDTATKITDTVVAMFSCQFGTTMSRNQLETFEALLENQIEKELSTAIEEAEKRGEVEGYREGTEKLFLRLMNPLDDIDKHMLESITKKAIEQAKSQERERTIKEILVFVDRDCEKIFDNDENEVYVVRDGVIGHLESLLPVDASW